MRKGLITRVDRVAERIAKRKGKFPPIICTLYDTDDDADIVGLTADGHHVVRLEGETVDEFLERARAMTGIPMWVAEYTETQ